MREVMPNRDDLETRATLMRLPCSHSVMSPPAAGASLRRIAVGPGHRARIPATLVCPKRRRAPAAAWSAQWTEYCTPVLEIVHVSFFCNRRELFVLVMQLRLRNDLYCVESGVKLYSLTHSRNVGPTTARYSISCTLSVTEKPGPF